MMQSPKIKCVTCAKIHVKSQSSHIDIMVSPKKHFKKMFEDEKYTNADKLKVILLLSKDIAREPNL